MVKTQERINELRKAGVRFFDAMPDGWKVLTGATTAPNGYTWIHNCKNPFMDAGYESGLLKNGK